jgi:hypothetical protein
MLLHNLRHTKFRVRDYLIEIAVPDYLLPANTLCIEIVPTTPLSASNPCRHTKQPGFQGLALFEPSSKFPNMNCKFVDSVGIETFFLGDWDVRSSVDRDC